MIGKDIIKTLSKKYQNNETVIRLKDGDKYLDIKTINIQQIVKKFAQNIFQRYRINEKTGK